MSWRGAMFILGGAIVGFGYQRLVGCRTGGCPVTSNQYIATLYGALVGYAASGGFH